MGHLILQFMFNYAGFSVNFNDLIMNRNEINRNCLKYIKQLPVATDDVPAVYMPGHEIPTFIALPCSYNPADHLTLIIIGRSDG
jgi:hypothetical protein